MVTVIFPYYSNQIFVETIYKGGFFMDEKNNHNYYDNTEIKSNYKKEKYTGGTSNLGNQMTKVTQNPNYSRDEEFAQEGNLSRYSGQSAVNATPVSDIAGNSYEEYASDFGNNKVLDKTANDTYNQLNTESKNVVNTTKNTLEEFASEANDIGSQLRKTGQNIVNDTKQNFAEFTKDTNDELSDASQNLINSTKNTLEEFASDANNTGSLIRNTGENIANNTRENLEEFAQEANLKSKAQNILHNTKDKIEEFASDAAEQIKKVGQNIVDTSKNIVSKTKDKVSQITKHKDDK